MATGGRERRRQPRARKAVPLEVLVTYQTPSGQWEDVRGTLADISEGGIGVELPCPLTLGSRVRVRGELAGGPYRHGSDSQARVSWCVPGTGHFKAGLAILGATRKEETAAPPPPVERVADYYDMMQLSPRADRDTIDRVFRLLAQRYHPDNLDTGNADLFRTLVEAHQVLSSPEQRAEYDVKFGHYQKVRWQIFDQTKAAQGPAVEKQLRISILHLLYTVRRNEPSQPSLNTHDLEELLGAPREHLTFSLWYLKEKSLVTRTDNGRYAITASGVDAAESQSMIPPKEAKAVAGLLR